MGEKKDVAAVIVCIVIISTFGFDKGIDQRRSIWANIIWANISRLAANRFLCDHQARVDR